MANRTPEPRIPRSEWKQHPNYPGQVLLLNSHASFRRISNDLLRAARHGDDPGMIGLYFSTWIAGMRSHERYEESKLYPYLERHHAAALNPLREGHHALHDAEAGVRLALQGDGNLHGALHRHDEVLDAHLELEEDTVIPLLLAMDRLEFARYLIEPIDRLLAAAPTAGG